jgi:hypothetical protein
MAGTQAVQAAKVGRTTVSEQDMDLIAMALNLAKNEDGSINVPLVLSKVHKALGDERFAQVAGEFRAFFAPTSLYETYTASWDLGWRGKTHTAASVIGLVAGFIVLCEVVGRTTDTPGLQLASRISRSILGIE